MKKIIISFVLLLITLILLLFLLRKDNSNKFKTVSILSVNQVDKIDTEKKIVEIAPDYSYKININYPYTGYNNLNIQIENLIKKYLSDFINSDRPPLENQIYSLDITYDTYKFESKVSYVFTIFLSTGGAHPNTIIETISYDTKINQIITIDTLLEQNSNILNVLSETSRNILASNKDLMQTNIKDMFLDGTKPTTTNYQNFAFTNDGLLIFFNRYQIAPYSYGSFQVLIPYSKLGIL